MGLGNFWRFPFLCYTYGGGAFLIPYCCVLVLIGVPLFLLELGVGQKAQVGATTAWVQIHPAVGGIGYSGVVATFFVALYYNVIVAWALFYLVNSFQSPLPWADRAVNASLPKSSNSSGGAGLGALDFFEMHALRCRASRDTYDWEGVEDWPSVFPTLFDTGGLVWPLVGCLAFGWFLIWLCVCKGIESLGRVAWFTAIFPYIVLVILLIRGLTLPGASVGLRFYLEPKFDQLWNIKVWLAAASQIFYSTGVGWGTLVAFASYNEHNHNFVRDTFHRLPPPSTTFHHRPPPSTTFHHLPPGARRMAGAPHQLQHVLPCGPGGVLGAWFHGGAGQHLHRGDADAGERPGVRRVPLSTRANAWRAVFLGALLRDGRLPRR